VLALVLNVNLAAAQPKVNNADIVKQLFDLVKSDTTTAFRFYRDNHCDVILRQNINKPTFVMTVSKFRVKGETNSYMPSSIRDKTIAAGYITYQPEEFDAIMKKVIEMGFKLNEKAGVGTNKMVYMYSNFSFVVEKHTEVAKPFYALALSDLAKTEQLMAGK